jgi:hypothetical protein
VCRDVPCPITHLCAVSVLSSAHLCPALATIVCIHNFAIFRLFVTLLISVKYADCLCAMSASSPLSDWATEEMIADPDAVKPDDWDEEVLQCTVLTCTVYCTVLYCTVLHSTVLHCIALCCTLLYCTVLYCTVLHCTALYCIALYCTVLYCTVLYCTVLYCTVLYCTALYCTVLYCYV